MLRKFVRDERDSYAAWVIVRRIIDRVAGGIHGRALKWQEANVPFTSLIIGSKRIQVDTGFSAHGPVWIEAVSHYEGRRYEPKIVIGKRFRASDRLHITAIDSITIGDDCLFGSNVHVADHAHGDYRSSVQSSPDSVPAGRRLTQTGPVVIGNNCWIGDNCVVLGGVSVGDGAIIAANSVILNDVPSASIAAGTPARIVKIFDHGTKKWARVMRHDVETDR